MEDIKTSLAEGKYMPDEKIPSEPELSELYHVSRITVRRAIEELCTEGYLVKKMCIRDSCIMGCRQTRCGPLGPAARHGE